MSVTSYLCLPHPTLCSTAILHWSLPRPAFAYIVSYCHPTSHPTSSNRLEHQTHSESKVFRRRSQEFGVVRQDGTFSESFSTERRLFAPCTPAFPCRDVGRAVLAVAATTTPSAVLAVVASSCGTGKCPCEAT